MHHLWITYTSKTRCVVVSDTRWCPTLLYDTSRTRCVTRCTLYLHLLSLWLMHRLFW